MDTSEKIKVLVVDDSELVLTVLTEILNADPKIEVIATAADPYEAAKEIKKQVPDVITLDIEMPRMDGITFLKKLMVQYPLPVIIISSYTATHADIALKAFEYGALYVLNKPTVQTKKAFHEYQNRFCEMVKLAAKNKVGRLSPLSGILEDQKPVRKEDLNIKRPAEIKMVSGKVRLIALGASAGGTVALQTILSSIDGTPPGIVITQHMPAGFTGDFANRLNSYSSLTVVEAQGSEIIEPGKVYIAPGDKHLIVRHENEKLYTRVINGPLVNHHRPSVDTLFESVAKNVGAKALGIILTGMGKDGSKGLLKMKESGAITMAQDEASSLVYGMPREALASGAAQTSISLDHIAPFISLIKS